MSPAEKRARPAVPRHSFKNVQAIVDAVVRRVVGSRDPEYEDVVQSTYVSVLSTFDNGKFRGECPPDGWAAIIARNVAVDAIRARTRERKIFSADRSDSPDFDPLMVVDRAVGPERQTELRRAVDRIGRALAGMAPDKAWVIYLHDILGCQLAEIATLTGTSIAAAQSRLVRARREVLEKLGSDL